MNELIRINYENETPSVNGRELYKALQIKTAYTDWFGRMCDYGFYENRDYETVLKNVIRADGAEMPQKQYDHQLSINMAKQLCMLQRTAIGRKFREYFIKIEESWNSPEKIMERAMQIAHQRAIEAERRIMQLEEENDVLQISLNQSRQYYTVAKYNKVFHKKWNMEQCKKIGKALSIYCNHNDIRIRKCETNDERFGSVNSYTLTAWNSYLGIED
ncbi:MAG: antA/AntB antirepressor family protein [Alphaproteobacteria bacterium]|nr:antA/AntB antirepressor family protein [Alphaproteobacteria bacterium]